MSSRNKIRNLKRFNAKQVKTTLVFILAATFLTSCTKSVPYEEIYKEKVHNKAEIDEKAEFLYVLSSDTSSSDNSGASAAQPFWQGNAQLVKFKFTETSLQAVQVVKDNRLKNNSLNEKIILEIPIEHIEYQCAEDKYGKCTNKEEENAKINWSQKKQFKPDFNALKTVAAAIIPVEMDKVFGNSCYTEVSSALRKYEIAGDAINIQLTKTYSADLKCLSSQGISVRDLSDLQSQLVQHFSFTKLNSIASKDYKAAVYPVRDENTFGFFTTDDVKLDVDYSQSESSRTQYLARWNPDKTEVAFYLSDNFNKPEFAAIKKSTQVAFDRFNEGLKAGNINTRIVLKEPAQKDPGDARNSMIVLVEDPISSGPLGYGPSVKDPRTGEILSARTVMYYGNLLASIKTTYDEIVQQLRMRETANVTVKEENKKELNAEVANSRKLEAILSAPIAQMIKSQYQSAKSAAALQVPSNFNAAAQSHTAHVHSLAEMNPRDANQALLISDKNLAEDDVMAAMSKHCTYPSEYIDFDVAIKTALHGRLGPNLKFWIEMNEVERQAIIDVVAPLIWLPTLVHELGHNMGLRHNFSGSVDKDNFYSKPELAKMGVQHEIPYSSVMDYGYSELNLLPTLGKYDIAALRFAYNREVELEDGQVAKVETTLKELLNSGAKLKPYSYCTDENVEGSPTCNRFDKGTNEVEIVKYLIAQYDNMYKRRNFRNDRESFSVFDDLAYARARRSNFNQIRSFMERYEIISSRYYPASSPNWVNVPWMKQTKEAAILSGKFFLDVMTTPDITCAVLPPPDKEVHGPRQVMVAPLNEITANASSCFDVRWNEGYTLIGQAGKAFNHQKNPDSENSYMDQIDVRGIYIDKILAAESLFKRKTGNSAFDRVEYNYLDIPELTGQIANTVNDLLIGNMTKKLSFKNQSGQEVLAVVSPMKLASPPNNSSTLALPHWIETPLNKSAAAMLRLPDNQVSYQQVLLNIIDTAMKGSQTHANEDRAFADSYRIIKTNTAYQVDRRNNPITTDIGNVRMIALKENLTSAQFASAYNQGLLIEKLSDEEFKKFIDEKTSVRFTPGQDTGANIPRTAIRASSFGPEYTAIPLEFAQAYRQGRISKEHYQYLLTILPASN